MNKTVNTGNVDL